MAVAAAMVAGDTRHQQLSHVSWNVRDTFRKYFQEEGPFPKETDLTTYKVVIFISIL